MNHRKAKISPVTLLLYAALLVAVASLAWGSLVYSQVAKVSAEPVLSYMHCSVLVSDSCNFYRGMAWLQGMNPHEPLVFWWALSLVVVAAVLKRSQRPSVS